MLRCHSLREITWQHPSQWSAVTVDGRPVAVWYKWGELKVFLGLPGGRVDDAWGTAPVFGEDVGGRHESQIDWADVEAATGIEIVDGPCQAR